MGFTNPFHAHQQTTDKFPTLSNAFEESLNLVSVCGNTSSTYSTSSSQSSTQSSQCSQIDSMGTFPPEATVKAVTRGESETLTVSSPPASEPDSGINRIQNTTGFGLSTIPGQLQYQPLLQRKYNRMTPAGREVTKREFSDGASSSETLSTSKGLTTANSNLVSRLGKFYASRSGQQQGVTTPSKHQISHIPSAINKGTNCRNESSNNRKLLSQLLLAMFSFI